MEEKETNEIELEQSSEIERGKTELDNNIPIPAEEEIEPHVSAKTWTVAAVRKSSDLHSEGLINEPLNI